MSKRKTNIIKHNIDIDVKNEIDDYYHGFETEWAPSLDNNNWKEIEPGLKEYIGEIPKITYNLSKNFLDETELIWNKIKKYGIDVKFNPSPHGIVKYYKFTDDVKVYYRSSIGTIHQSMRKSLQYDITQQILSSFFDDMTKVRIELVTCFLTNSWNKYSKKVKKLYTDCIGDKTNMNNIISECKKYLDENITNSDIKKNIYHIYLFTNGSNRYMFYSDKKITNSNIGKYIKNIDIVYDKKVHTYELIQKIEFIIKIQLEIEFDMLLQKYDMVPNSHNNYLFFSIHNDITKIETIKNKIFISIQQQLFEKHFIDTTDYSEIQEYIYEISNDEYKYVDKSNADVPLKINVLNIYEKCERNDTENGIYKRLFEKLMANKYDKFTFHIIKTKKYDENSDLIEWKNKYINDNIDKSLNAEKTTINRYRENSVIQFLIENFNYDWIFNEYISLKNLIKPDVRLMFDDRVILIEIDENQHRVYKEKQETKRTMKYYDEYNTKKHVFLIRFNPDSYKRDNIMYKSCWKNKNCQMFVSDENNWKYRLSILKDTIDRCISKKPDIEMTIFYLFYDADNIKVMPHKCNVICSNIFSENNDIYRIDISKRKIIQEIVN